MQTSTVPVSRSRWLRDHVVKPVLISPAARFFALVWSSAAIYAIFASGFSFLFISLVIALGASLLFFLTAIATKGAPRENATPAPKLRLRIVLLLVLIPVAMRLLLPIVHWIGECSEQYLSQDFFIWPYNVVFNPIFFVLIPLAVLLLSGVRPQELGLGRGHRSWRTIALLSLVMGGLKVSSLVTASPVDFLRYMVNNMLVNGFSEEFLYRGVFQTRLARLVRPDWALVIQTLLFGMMHLGANIEQFDGDFMMGLAWCLLSQSVVEAEVG